MGKQTRERDISMCILVLCDTRTNLTKDGLPNNLNWILEFSPNEKGSVEVIDNIISNPFAPVGTKAPTCPLPYEWYDFS